MNFKFGLYLGFCSAVLVGCGDVGNSHRSDLMERNPVVRPQGEPDYKTSDGISLMDWVKKPEVRQQICAVLVEANKKGFSVNSAQAAEMVAQQFKLHPVEAEVVATYSQSFTCPDLP